MGGTESLVLISQEVLMKRTNYATVTPQELDELSQMLIGRSFFSNTASNSTLALQGVLSQEVVIGPTDKVIYLVLCLEDNLVQEFIVCRDLEEEAIPTMEDWEAGDRNAWKAQCLTINFATGHIGWTEFPKEEESP